MRRVLVFHRDHCLACRSCELACSVAHSAAESFDVITCFDVLEHLYEPRKVMARVGEWLKPGGIFYVLVPNVDSAEARAFGSYWHGLELPRHLFHYSPASLK